MIIDADRSGWFGASDVSQIMSRWESDTFKGWWLEKLGIRRNTFVSKAMRVGTVLEHKILDTIPNVTRDRQILIPELKLRVNLDGETDIVHEVKTHRGEYKVSLAHRRQVNVQMFAAEKGGEIVSYQVTEDDYRNYFLPVDLSRLVRWPIEYDEKFIAEFLERLKVLADCLEHGKMPRRQ